MDYAIHVHDLVWFLIVGGLAGWLASVMVDGGGLGIIGDIVIGIFGAFFGGFLANVLGFDVYGFWGVLGMATLGAVILLTVLRIVNPRKRFARN
jgi:uncharacterized membrane protein YeaQ/YmgE (transglycosylase-associated protein family)